MQYKKSKRIQIKQRIANFFRSCLTKNCFKKNITAPLQKKKIINKTVTNCCIYKLILGKTAQESLYNENNI